MNIISIFKIKIMNYCIYKLKIKGYWNIELIILVCCFNFFFIIFLFYKILFMLCKVDNRVMGKYLNFIKFKIENKLYKDIFCLYFLRKIYDLYYLW